MRRTRIPLLSVFCIIALFGAPGCDSSETIEDLGVRPSDSGTRDAGRPDAAPRPDGGDASTAPDLGADAGPSLDAEPNADAEPNPDAEAEDAGPGLPPCNVDIDAVAAGQLRMTADDAWTTYLNGALVVPRIFGWNSPSTTAVEIFLHPLRPNAIAIYAENLFVIDGYDRGVIAELTYTTSTAVTHEVLTSSTTRVATSSTAGWTDPDFDDLGWSLATVEGPHGMGPWGAVLGSSNAQWVWSYDSNLPATQKPMVEEVFLRITFYVHRDGSIRTEPDACAP